jgi:hypothetical protein
MKAGDFSRGNEYPSAQSYLRTNGIRCDRFFRQAGWRQQMPTVLRVKGYRFFFFSLEGK